MTQPSDTLRRPWLDERLAAFEATNADLVPTTCTLLDDIVADPSRHARLVNTLSLLEHMGSHRIMATQRSASIDQPTLQHLAEETGHAFFMKRNAERIAGRPMEYVADDLLAPLTARRYFQRLEATMARSFAGRDTRAVYLCMSMVIEFRALWFYGLYQQALDRAGTSISLRRVIGEERRHLSDMTHRLDLAGELDDARIDLFLRREQQLFERLLARFAGDLPAAA